MISLESSGSFDSTESYLKRLSANTIFNTLSRFGDEGVHALAAATPRDTGLTAQSWSYEIVQDSKSWSIIWSNSHMDHSGQTPVAILIQLGHATGTGGYVQGRDFINPALRPLFDKMADLAWKEVTR